MKVDIKDMCFKCKLLKSDVMSTLIVGDILSGTLQHSSYSIVLKSPTLCMISSQSFIPISFVCNTFILPFQIFLLIHYFSNFFFIKISRLLQNCKSQCVEIQRFFFFQTNIKGIIFFKLHCFFIRKLCTHLFGFKSLRVCLRVSH